MANDELRTNLNIELYCSKHPQQKLKYSTDSKVGATSAYGIDLKIIIHPCVQCKRENDHIKRAVKTLMAIK